MKWRTHEKTENMPVKMLYRLKNKQQKVTMSTCGIVLYSSTGTRVYSKGQCIWIDIKCRLPKEDFIINSKNNLANTFLLCLTFCLVFKIHMAISIYSRCIALLCLLQNRLRLEIAQSTITIFLSQLKTDSHRIPSLWRYSVTKSVEYYIPYYFYSQ